MEVQVRVVTFSEAKSKLNDILDQVVEDVDYTIIKRRNSGDAVVMSLETFNSYMETFHLLKSPNNAEHLVRSIDQYQRGQVQLRDLINE